MAYLDVTALQRMLKVVFGCVSEVAYCGVWV